MNKDLALKLRASSPIIGTIRAVLWHLIESTLLRRAARLIYVSDTDRDFANRHYRVQHIPAELIPNQVAPSDEARFRDQALQLRGQLLAGYRQLACMMGDLGAIQNRLAAQYIVHTLAPATPDTHYILIGRNPEELPSQANVTFTGFVDHFDPYLLAADLCIAPLEVGSGTKTKVLDYMKYHKHIIATPVGAEGIDVSAYPSIRVVDLTRFPTAVTNSPQLTT